MVANTVKINCVVKAAEFMAVLEKQGIAYNSEYINDQFVINITGY